MTRTRRATGRWIVLGVAVAVGVALTAFVVTRAPSASAATDLALGKPATASATEAGRGANLANDGNPNTRWCAADGRTGHWWQVDLGSTANLTGTSIRWEFARTYKYVIAVSTDGATWTTAADRRNNTSATQTQNDTFTARGRYLRITVTGLSPGSWASMYTVSVLGDPGGNPSPSPTATGDRQPYKGVANSACNDLTRLTVSWYYNWLTSPDNCRAAEFVPMIWGNQKTPEAVRSALNQISNAGYRTVLGFNEPNKTSQANMPVSQAIQLWPHLTSNPNIKVGSPATSADAGGQAWFRDFMRQADAQGLRVDFITVHWYGWNAGSCDASATNFERYLSSIESFTGDRPIWITEYGCLHNSAQDRKTVEDFYKGSVAMLAKHPRVQRYAWYPWATNNHLVQNDQLTPLGNIFASMPAYK